MYVRQTIHQVATSAKVGQGDRTVQQNISNYYLVASRSKTNPKILVNHGSGWAGLWVCPGLTRIFFIGKSSKNSPIRELIFWSSIGLPRVLCLYIYFI